MPSPPTDDRWSAARRATVLAVVASVVLMVEPAFGSGDAEQIRTRIATTLEQAEGPAPPSARALGRQLSGLGTDALPVLFAALASDRPPDGGERPLSPPQEEALLEGLVDFGRVPLRDFLTQATAGRFGMDERAAMLRILARVGDARELGLAAWAAEPADEETDVDPTLQTLLQEAAEAILARDETGYGPMRRIVLDTHPVVASLLVLSVAEVGSPVGLKTLSELLGYAASLDPVLLTSIGRMADRVPRPIDEQVLASVRGLLGDDDHQLVREAALASGKLVDYDAIEPLIDLLESDDRGIAANARWSLRTITGLALAPRAERWKLWLDTERRWFDEDAPRIFEQLDARDPARVVAALSEVAKRRYRRNELALEVERTLQRRDPAIRRLGCIALRQLGSPAAVPALIECLADPEQTVVQLAWAALKSITGDDLPADRSEWRERYALRRAP